MIFYILALWARASEYINSAASQVAQRLRDWLGQSPMYYYICDDGQIIPTTTNVPQEVRRHMYVYDPHTHRITQADNPNPTGRFRPLAILSMRIENPIVGNIDICDWLGNVRANPVPNLRFQQILALWSCVHNVYIPHNVQTNVYLVRSNGDEEQHTL